MHCLGSSNRYQVTFSKTKVLTKASKQCNGAFSQSQSPLEAEGVVNDSVPNIERHDTSSSDCCSCCEKNKQEIHKLNEEISSLKKLFFKQKLCPRIQANKFKSAAYKTVLINAVEILSKQLVNQPRDKVDIPHTKDGVDNLGNPEDMPSDIKANEKKQRKKRKRRPRKTRHHIPRKIL